jgi:hypothetical protein
VAPERAEQRSAQAELAALDSERQLRKEFPARIGQVLGGGETATQAGQMLAPAVEALGEQTANELLTGLVAEGLSQEQALEALAGVYPQLVESSVQQVRQAHGLGTAFNEAKAMYFRNTG